MNIPKTYTAIDLLDKVFEFTEMTPNPKEWKLDALFLNPPRRVRLQQVEALLKAFCVPDAEPGFFNKVKTIFSDQSKISIEAFLKGDFIKKRTIDEYSPVVRFIEDFVRNKVEDSRRDRNIYIEELAFIFPKLIDFKRQLRWLLTYNSGWLEAGSKTALFSIYLTNDVAQNLVGKYDQLDKAITLFINPKQLTFTKAELIEKYNFPTESLEDVDMDFM